MKTFANNRDLLGYLGRLAALLQERGTADLSRQLRTSMAHAAMDTSEFLGESRIALRRVLTEASGLPNDERMHVQDALEQVERAWSQSYPNATE